MIQLDHEYVSWFLSHDWTDYSGSCMVLVNASGEDGYVMLLRANRICTSCGWTTVSPELGKPAMRFDGRHCRDIIATEVLDS